MIEGKAGCAGYEVAHEDHFPKHAVNLLPVALGDEVAHACHDAVEHGVENRGKATNHHCVVAVECHHFERDKRKDEYLVALHEQEVLHLVYKHLPRLPDQFRILAAHAFAQTYLGGEPRIGAADFAIDGNGIDDAEQQFDRNPQIEAPDVGHGGYLHKGLDEHHRLEMGGYHVVLLVGLQQDLLVVHVVAYQRGRGERPEGKVNDA